MAARLALLCRLNEQPSLRSPLYDPAAGLCGVLRPFLTDISRARGAWRDRGLILQTEETATAKAERVWGKADDFVTSTT